MIPKNVKQIMQTLLDNKYEVFIIGGAIRDILFGIIPKDWDLFTNATGEQILNIFPNGKVLGGEERQAKILTVIVNGIEVSQYRNSGDRIEVGIFLEEHLKTCDSTINSIAMDINGNIYDINNGMEDLKNKIIKAVGNPQIRIEEDSLRIFRYILHSLKYKFKIEQKTIDAIKNNIHLLKNIPVERITTELIKILKYENCIKLFNKLEITKIMFPKFARLYKVEGGDYHKENVGQHSQLSFETSCNLTDRWQLRFATLVHDYGKWEAFSEDENGIINFYQHELIGSKEIEKLLKYMKVDDKSIKYIITLIRLHMVGYLDNMNDKTIKKLMLKLRDAGINVYDYIIMKYCDYSGNLAHRPVKFGDFLGGYKLLQRIRDMEQKQVPLSIKDLKINGRDIMKYNIQGSAIGDNLKRMFNEVDNGNIPNDRFKQLEKLKEWLE